MGIVLHYRLFCDVIYMADWVIHFQLGFKGGGGPLVPLVSVVLVWIKSLLTCNISVEVDSAGGKSQGVIHTCEDGSFVRQHPPWGIHRCCWTQGTLSLYVHLCLSHEYALVLVGHKHLFLDNVCVFVSLVGF